MRYDLDEQPTAIAYKLLAATVMPRPIAWVVTQDANGQRNAAPYSFFNAMGAKPPVVALGIQADPDKGIKDSARNIRDTGEFVVNLVPEGLVEKMNITAVNAPTGVDELELAGLEVAASAHIAPPRIVASPVAFECVTHTLVPLGETQFVVIGRVLAVHVDDDKLLNAEKAYIDTPALDLVGRSFGSDYVRSKDTFQLDRPVWQKGEDT